MQLIKANNLINIGVSALNFKSSTFVTQYHFSVMKLAQLCNLKLVDNCLASMITNCAQVYFR